MCVKQNGRIKEYDVVWREGVLGMRFTPNEDDLPVVCQTPKDETPASKAAPSVAVGDILFAFRAHSYQRDVGIDRTTEAADGSISPNELEEHEMEYVKSFDQIISLLKYVELPMTLRFH